MVAEPRTAMLQPAGAMKRLPAAVVPGVSRASRSAFVADAAELAVFAGALSGATAGFSESGVPLRQLPPGETRRNAMIVARTRKHHEFLSLSRCTAECPRRESNSHEVALGGF